MTLIEVKKLNKIYGSGEAEVKALKKEMEPNFGPDRVGDIKHSNACIDKAREMLEYNPEYDFEHGISLAIEWYKDNL